LRTSVASPVGEAGIRDHQPVTIEELQFAAIADEGETSMRGANLPPLAAELFAVQVSPGYRQASAAVGVEMHPGRPAVADLPKINVLPEKTRPLLHRFRGRW
jgi:hypothetical protein